MVRRRSHCVMLTWLMFMPPMAMLVSVRSRRPLIMVVFCSGCPAVVVFMVILKSPLIGCSVSGFLCANEMAVATVAAKMITMDKINLLFMNKTPFGLVDDGKTRANYQKV